MFVSVQLLLSSFFLFSHERVIHGRTFYTHQYFFLTLNVFKYPTRTRAQTFNVDFFVISFFFLFYFFRFFGFFLSFFLFWCQSFTVVQWIFWQRNKYISSWEFFSLILFLMYSVKIGCFLFFLPLSRRLQWIQT